MLKVTAASKSNITGKFAFALKVSSMFCMENLTKVSGYSARNTSVKNLLVSTTKPLISAVVGARTVVPAKKPYPSRDSTILFVGPSSTILGITDGCFETEGAFDTDGAEEGAVEIDGAGDMDGATLGSLLLVGLALLSSIDVGMGVIDGKGVMVGKGVTVGNGVKVGRNVGASVRQGQYGS